MSVMTRNWKTTSFAAIARAVREIAADEGTHVYLYLRGEMVVARTEFVADDNFINTVGPTTTDGDVVGWLVDAAHEEIH